MRYHSGQGSYEQGIYYGRKILDIDPLREEVHREVMRLLDQNGERPQAIRQYESCRQILAQELEIQPMLETQTLYKQLFTANGQLALPASNKAGEGQPENLQQALRQLDQALLSLEEVRGQLNHARQLFTHFLNR
jgi:DNA-binding SARP family transcriptional activator